MTTTIQTENTYNFLSTDGDKSISISKNGLSLKRDILSTVKETIISPIDITDVNTGNIITMARLTYLPIGLGALTVPTDGLTCNFNDAIQLQDYNDTPTPPPTHSEVKIGSNPSTLYGMNINTTTTTPFTMASNTDILITSVNTTLDSATNIIITGGDNVSINATNDSINLTSDDNINLVSNGYGNITLDAPNINSFGYALPLCFDILTIDRTVNYTSGGQNWYLAWVENANIPKYFFTETPQTSYTSANWRIDFTINTWNNGSQNNSSDKALAYYIVFEDQNSNIYTPILFNSLTPFCRHNNNSTWSGGGSNFEFQPFTWTDYIDFSGLIGSGSGNLPLKINLYCAFDNPKDFTFSMKVGLTRTNILP